MTPQRMVDLQNSVKGAIKRIGVNGMIDVRAAYFTPDAVECGATVSELQEAAFALGMTRISNWRYQTSADLERG